MTEFLVISAALSLLVLFILFILFMWRIADHRADRIAWQQLLEMSEGDTGTFRTSAIADLPEPAQRYFRFSITEGTPLRRAVAINMTGQLGLGNNLNPRYQPMTASQLLVPPYGLVWRLKSRWFGGSDGVLPTTSWTRFWFFGLLPMVRVGNNEDHRHAAFGRVVAEAAFWAPFALLPGEHVAWEAMDENHVKARVTFAGFTQDVVLTLLPDGQPTQVVIQRWSNENPEREFQYQPFGGTLSGFQLFEGYRLPTLVEGGNHIETPAYFPFYRVTVTGVRFY